MPGIDRMAHWIKPAGQSLEILPKRGALPTMEILLPKEVPSFGDPFQRCPQRGRPDRSMRFTHRQFLLCVWEQVASGDWLAPPKPPKEGSTDVSPPPRRRIRIKGTCNKIYLPNPVPPATVSVPSAAVHSTCFRCAKLALAPYHVLNLQIWIE